MDLEGYEFLQIILPAKAHSGLQQIAAAMKTNLAGAICHLVQLYSRLQKDRASSAASEQPATDRSRPADPEPAITPAPVPVTPAPVVTQASVVTSAPVVTPAPTVTPVMSVNPVTPCSVSVAAVPSSPVSSSPLTSADTQFLRQEPGPSDLGGCFLYLKTEPEPMFTDQTTCSADTSVPAVSGQLASLLARVDQLARSQDLVLGRLELLSQSAPRPPGPNLPLPAATLQDVDSLETLLDDDTNMDALVTYLAGTYGGCNLKIATREMCCAIFGGNTSTYYSYTGKSLHSQKRRFHGTKLHRAILRALRKNPGTAGSSQRDVTGCLKRWFQGSRDRAGGRLGRLRLKNSAQHSAELQRAPSAS